MGEAVLVTDGDERAALAVVRSLGRAGYAVHVCSTRGRSLAGASRYCMSEERAPDPLRAPGDFVDALEQYARRVGARVLLPISEASVLAVLADRERFRDMCIPFPDEAAFHRVCDKPRVLQAARALGIEIPEQRLLTAAGEIDALDPDAVRYPVVVKPGRSVAGDAHGRQKTMVSYARDDRELRAQLERLPAAAFPVLLQQRIVGPGVGIFLLLWDGRTDAVFSHRRIREKPPSGGVSVYRESIPADPALVRASTALLEAFGWQGVAMVEYKVDASTGEPYLMEVNGRFWGSLQLAIDAGVDFPVRLVRLALGEPLPPQPAYRVGVRSRWWWGDVDHLIAVLRQPRDGIALPPDLPPKWRSVLDVLVPWRPGDRNEVFRWSDPMPAVRETLNWFARR
ncbi:MAG: ATP-grasp domain-containing protein [bacterium]|jgi:predicted ATP-grasp superfamily ATP-dependent carboligase|nr:MAG: ATP-dependent carboxylate-amine ligase [bacterium]